MAFEISEKFADKLNSFEEGMRTKSHGCYNSNLLRTLYLPK